MAGFRTSLKKLVPLSWWPMFRAVDKYVIDLLYTFLWAKRTLYTLPERVKKKAPANPFFAGPFGLSCLRGRAPIR